MSNSTLCNSSPTIIKHLSQLYHHSRFKLYAQKSSNCFAFTPTLLKLSLPLLHINNILISYVDSVKYLAFTFADAHQNDNDMLRQMLALYACSNRLLRIFHGCNTKVPIEFGRSYCSA